MNLIYSIRYSGLIMLSLFLLIFIPIGEKQAYAAKVIGGDVTTTRGIGHKSTDTNFTIRLNGVTDNISFASHKQGVIGQELTVIATPGILNTYVVYDMN